MLRGVDEPDPVAGVDEECPSARNVLEDSVSVLLAELDVEALLLRHETHERLRDVRRKVVDEEDPLRFRVARHSPLDVEQEILFGSGAVEGRSDDLARDDVEVGRQAHGAVADVVELASLHLAGSRRFRRRDGREGLDRGFLVGAHDANAIGSERRGISVEVADGGNLSVMCGLVLDDGVEPVA